jgi:hypothetical protein
MPAHIAKAATIAHGCHLGYLRQRVLIPIDTLRQLGHDGDVAVLEPHRAGVFALLVAQPCRLLGVTQRDGAIEPLLDALLR